MTEKTKIYLLSICGILFTYTLFQSYHSDNIFQIFIYIFLGAIILFIFLSAIFKNRKKYKNTKDLKSYSIILIVITLVTVNLGIFIYYEIKLNEPTLLKSQNHGVYADFKQDGTYIIKSGSWASRKHFYGKYTIEDSIIKVDRKTFDDILVTNTFVIRKINNAFGKDDKNGTRNYLIELNLNGKEIKNRLIDFDKAKNEIYDSYKFEVTTDNRK